MSLTKKIDRRVCYSKAAIRESFLALLAKKPIEKISVTEICSDANINRGTFYAHYADPFDLRRCLADELALVLKARMDELGVTRLKSVEIFTLFRENSELCRIFAGKNGDSNALHRLIAKAADAYLGQEPDRIGKLSAEQLEYIRLMLIASITATVKHWLDTGLAAEPEELAAILDRFCSRGILDFVCDK